MDVHDHERHPILHIDTNESKGRVLLLLFYISVMVAKLIP